MLGNHGKAIKWIWTSCALFCLCTSCSSIATRSGSVKELSSEHRALIRSLGIIVHKESEFTITYSADQEASLGAVIILGPLGAWAERASRISDDENTAEDIKPLLADFDPQLYMKQKLFEYFSKSSIAEKSLPIDTDKPTIISQENIDTILEVNIRYWGLRRCLDTENKNLLNVIFDTNSKLLSAGTGEVVWEYNKIFIDNNKYSLYDFRSNPGLLKKVMEQAARSCSQRIFNEIQYSQN